VVDERDSAQGAGEPVSVGDSQERLRSMQRSRRSRRVGGSARSGRDEERSDEGTVAEPRVGKKNPSPEAERVVVVRGGLEPPTFRFQFDFQFDRAARRDG
jgi:hypothetical protein